VSPNGLSSTGYEEIYPHGLEKTVLWFRISKAH
jgi:hypothetical protein